jgi:hypothetical protein
LPLSLQPDQLQDHFSCHPIKAVIVTTTRPAKRAIMSNSLRASLQENYALLKTHAIMLAKAGNVEKTIKEFETKDGAVTFLDEERKKLINLATKYDCWNDVLGDYVQAEHQAQQENLDALLEKLNSTKLPDRGGDGKLETEIRSALGMPKTQRTAKKAEDDELTVVEGQNSGNGLTCPLTASFLEDPVKNSRCGHAYSKAAIIVHLGRTSVCPVAGCGNKDVRKSHLVPDLELIQLVRRQKRRRDAEREHLHLSQALDEEETEDEDDDSRTVVIKQDRDE